MSNNIELMPYGRFEGTPMSELNANYLLELHESERLNKSKLNSKEKLVREYIDMNILAILDACEYSDCYHEEDFTEFYDED